MTSAQVKKQDAIESVHLSPDEKALMVSLVHEDPEVVAFAKAGGMGEASADAVESAKRIFKIGVLGVATGSAQTTVSELLGSSHRSMPCRPCQQVATQLGETVGKELDRMVGDQERPGALSAALGAVTAEAAKSLADAVRPIQDALLGNSPSALPQVLEVRLLDALTRGTRDALDRLFDVEGGSPLMTHLANGEKAIATLREENVAIEGRLRGQIIELAEKVVAQQAQAPTPVQAGNNW